MPLQLLSFKPPSAALRIEVSYNIHI